MWWESLSLYQQILFVIGVATTAFMIIQIIMMFVSGIGGEDVSFENSTSDMDLDTEGDIYNDEGIGVTFFGLKILSVRSIVAFLAMFSWVTFTFEYFMPTWGATLLGVGVGILAALGVAYMMKSIEKYQSSGNLNISNAIGKNGEVYLVIPAARSGNGKVNVYVQERYAEYEAVTDDPEPIKTGAKVKITGTLDSGTLIVERTVKEQSVTAKE